MGRSTNALAYLKPAILSVAAGFSTRYNMMPRIPNWLGDYPKLAHVE